MNSSLTSEASFGLQDAIDRTNWNSMEKTFTYNILIFLALVIFSLFFHAKMFIFPRILLVWSFQENKYITFINYRAFLRNLKDYYKTVLSLNRNLFKFIDVFGFQIYIFIYLELLLCFSFTCLTGLMLGIWYSYNLRGKTLISLADFIFGNLDFEDNCNIISIFAFLFAFLFLYFLIWAKRGIETAHLICFGKYKKFESKLGIMANVIYVSKIPPTATSEAFKEQMSHKLGLNSQDYTFIRFPGVSKLYRYKTKIAKIKNRLDNLDCVYWWFVCHKNNKIKELQNSITNLTQKYKKELSQPLSYTQTGLLCIYSPVHLERFFKFTLRCQKQCHGYESENDETNLILPFFSSKNLRLELLAFVFLFNYENFNFKNLNARKKNPLFIRLILYTIVIFILVFITTPLSLLEILISIFFKKRWKGYMTNQIVAWRDSRLNYILMPIILSLMNVLFLFVIAEIARTQRFYRLATYHQFILRFSFLYLMINSFFVPGFAVVTNGSLFSVLTNLDWDVNAWIYNLRIYEQSTVISSIILQSGAVGFFLTLNLIADGFLNAFKYPLLLAHLRNLNSYPYLKNEGDIFEFGYYYGYNTTILYLVVVFGIYKPLIVISGAVYFGLKSLANLVAQTHYFGSQFESGTVLPNMFLNRAKFCIPLMFFLLSLKCFIIKNFLLFGINFSAFFVGIFLSLTVNIKAFPFGKLFELVNYVSFGILIRKVICYSF